MRAKTYNERVLLCALKLVHGEYRHLLDNLWNGKTFIYSNPEKMTTIDEYINVADDFYIEQKK
jgi:hypothetical protein